MCDKSLKAAITGMWSFMQEYVSYLLTVPSSVLSRSRIIWKHYSHWLGTVKMRIDPTLKVCLSKCSRPSLLFISQTFAFLSRTGCGDDKGTVQGKMVAYSSTVIYFLRKGSGKTSLSLLCLPTTKTVQLLSISSFSFIGVQLRITCCFERGCESLNIPFSSSALYYSERLMLFVRSKYGIFRWISCSSASLAPSITRPLRMRVPSMSIAKPILRGFDACIL